MTKTVNLSIFQRTASLPAAFIVFTVSAYGADPAKGRVVGSASHKSVRPQQAENITVSASNAHHGATGKAPGGGLMAPEQSMKTTQTISRDFIVKQAPTSNPLQLLSALPGANVALTDPYGLVGGTMTLRGLSSAQIGWIYEGAPLNDIGGGSFYANEVIDAENLNQVAVQPGTANIDTPTISASGGVVNIGMIAPSTKPGGYGSISYGAFKLNREFVRLESGMIGNTGIRGFVSYSHAHANDWRGSGGNEKQHVDMKLLREFGEDSSVALVVSYNRQINQQDLYPTLAQFRATGNTNYNGTYSGIADTAFYKLHVNPYENLVASLPTSFHITRDFMLSDTPYLWWGHGNGGGASALTEGVTYAGPSKVGADLNADGLISGGEKVLAYTPTWSRYYRVGNTLKGGLHLGPHDITLGYWYEWSNEPQRNPVGLVNQTTGEAADIWGENSLVRLSDGQPYYTRNIRTQTQINMLFFGDTVTLMGGRLQLQAGFREAMVSRKIYNYLPGAARLSGQNIAEPLPQVGLRYKFNDRHQIYVTGSTNFRTTTNTSLVNVYSSSTGNLTTAANTTNPEYSIEEEIGYRYQGERIIADVAFFNYNFTNRMLSLNTYQNGATTSITANAGGQTSRGVDIQVATRPVLRHLRPYVSFEYLDARTDNNIRSGNDYLPTKGKVAVQAPRTQAALGLDWDDGSFFANVNIKYVGSQYSTLMNDQKVPYYVTDSVTLGYRLKQLSLLKAPQFQLNLSNITGAVRRTGVYSFTSNALATRGVYGTTIAGSAPTYYLLPGFTMMGTLSTSF
ncbi:TonB-dependent receptor plug domain-containing protein [Acetobacter musti]|uniref:TonB-dependent receptor plug domain-containing protein n=1 Tax=Acetobacter musti TaxID=864732 RepID=A0ABX0JUW7_9PROT|nr:TonB-dependent receptor [Acetobacter musti]NHN86775.1 TonB-dependent receptor plug domain-containing protein [Acetobacter musti]